MPDIIKGIQKVVTSPTPEGPAPIDYVDGLDRFNRHLYWFPSDVGAYARYHIYPSYLYRKRVKYDPPCELSADHQPFLGLALSALAVSFCFVFSLGSNARCPTKRAHGLTTQGYAVVINQVFSKMSIIKALIRPP